MTERELCEIRVLSVEIACVRNLIRVGRETASETLLREHLGILERRRFELLAYVVEIPDPLVRVICLMRYAEGLTWETVARRLHYERTTPAKIVRRWFSTHGVMLGDAVGKSNRSKVTI